jgi:hypothetical protein
MSSIFFLASRISKTSTGLAEFDVSVTKIEQIGKASLESYENKKLYNYESELDEILSRYF